LSNHHYKYTGKPLDDDGGLGIYYYGARYYDARIGRFLAVDPLKNKYPSWSPYVYCANNPLKYIDPFGLSWYDMQNGDIQWYDADFVGPIQGEYHGENLYYDFTDNLSGFNEHTLIPTHFSNGMGTVVPNVSSEFHDLAIEVVSILENEQTLSMIYLLFAPGHTYDIKINEDMIFGQYDFMKYRNEIKRKDDMGNILFGIGGAATGTSPWILFGGAGYAQIKAKTSSLGYWRSFYDDPRDSYHISYGISLYSLGLF